MTTDTSVRITKLRPSRRELMTATAGASLVFAAAEAVAQGDARVRIHRFDQAQPFPVNAYLIEGSEGVVVVDATLTNTASHALRARADDIGKPLAAVLLTHPHPDHYAGLGNLTTGLDVPIVSVAGVNDVVRRDDEQKDQIVGGMFQDEWPQKRVFPNEVVADGASLDFGPGLKFRVVDIGPAESFHDSVFILEGTGPVAFVGDLAYGLMHPYMADNQNPAWRKAIERLKGELPEDMVLYVGHGAPVTPGFLTWQAIYLDKFEEAILAADWQNPDAAAASVVERMRDFLPSEDLLFLMQLSIEPNARGLGKL